MNKRFNQQKVLADITNSQPVWNPIQQDSREYKKEQDICSTKRIRNYDVGVKSRMDQDFFSFQNFDEKSEERILIESLENNIQAFSNLFATSKKMRNEIFSNEELRASDTLDLCEPNQIQQENDTEFQGIQSIKNNANVPFNWKVEQGKSCDLTSKIHSKQKVQKHKVFINNINTNNIISPLLSPANEPPTCVNQIRTTVNFKSHEHFFKQLHRQKLKSKSNVNFNFELSYDIDEDTEQVELKGKKLINQPKLLITNQVREKFQIQSERIQKVPQKKKVDWWINAKKTARNQDVKSIDIYFKAMKPIPFPKIK